MAERSTEHPEANSPPGERTSPLATRLVAALPNPAGPQDTAPADDTSTAGETAEASGQTSDDESTDSADELNSAQAPATGADAGTSAAQDVGSDTSEADPSTASESAASGSDAQDSGDAASPPAPSGTAEGGESDQATDPDQTTDAGQAADETDTPAEPEYRPLEEVEDTIRTRLANPIAQQQMQAALDRVRSAMQDYGGKYVSWEVSQMEVAEDKRSDPPPLPDLAELARSLGLEYGEIPLMGPYEVQEYELGQAYDLQFTGTGIAQISFVDVAYSEDFPLFKAAEIGGAMTDTQFLFWKIEQAEERVPTLDEARDRVVEVIQKQRAFELAKQAAEEEAEQVRKSEKSLQEVFAESRTVLDTGEFSWMTTGSLPGTMGVPRLTQIPGLDGIGEEFMRTVFAHGEGDVVVAPSQDHTVAYVVYISRQTVDEQELRRRFLEGGLNSAAIQRLAFQQLGNTLRNWYEQLRERYGVSWNREPMTFRRDA